VGTIHTKQGDLTPWVITLSGSTGALDLAGVVTIGLYARRMGIRHNRINGTTCAITTSSEGVITYTPVVADVSVPGTHLLNYNLLSAAGTTSFWAPSADYDRLVIHSNLALST
jgi:hypothetical protein